jgi:hypothetical protein
MKPTPKCNGTTCKNQLILAAFVAILAFLPLASAAHAQCSTSLSTWNGKYAWGGWGDDYTTVNLIDRAQADVGWVTFNGTGGVSTKIIENLAGTISTINESGTYTQNPDCSYTVAFTGATPRKFNMEVGSVDPTTGIAQGGDADDVDAGEDIKMELSYTTDPAGGCQQSYLAGAWGGGFSGYNTSLDVINTKASGDLRFVIDASGNITGSGHESDGGTNQDDTVTGTATLASDCSFLGTLYVNGQSFPLAGQLENASSSQAASSVVREAATPAFATASHPGFRSWHGDRFGSWGYAQPL